MKKIKVKRARRMPSPSCMHVLKAWLAMNPRGRIELANHLQYRTPDTIYQWIKRGRIPVHQEERVMKVIRGD